MKVDLGLSLTSLPVLGSGASAPTTPPGGDPDTIVTDGSDFIVTNGSDFIQVH